MIFIKMQDGNPVEHATKLTNEQHQDPAWQSRWDWKTFETVQELASKLTAMTGTTFLAIDNGDHVSPRYDVLEAPKIGDKVSRGFNGDYYPEGEIVAITKKYKVTTSTGIVFRRRGNTAKFLQAGGTFGMIGGHIDERNPSF